MFHHDRMGIYHVGTELETAGNAKYANERKATAFARVIQHLFEKWKTRGLNIRDAGAPWEAKSRLKIYGLAGTSLRGWEGCVLKPRLSFGMSLLTFHAGVAPCSSARIPKHNAPCKPQVHVECPEVLLSVVSPGHSLGKAFGMFCLQRKPRDAFCSSETRRAFRSFVKYLEYACLSSMPGVFTW